MRVSKYKEEKKQKKTNNTFLTSFLMIFFARFRGKTHLRLYHTKGEAWLALHHEHRDAFESACAGVHVFMQKMAQRDAARMGACAAPGGEQVRSGILHRQIKA